MATIALIGALDTKGGDFAFVRQQIEARGHETLLINTGVVGEPTVDPDVDATTVADEGGTSLDALREAGDRGQAIEVMARGAAAVAKHLYDHGRFDGILGLGGSAGTTVGTAAMRALPVGVPKLMVSTVAAGDTTPYVGTADITMMPSVVDVAGVNSISALIYSNAAGAIVGMVETEVLDADLDVEEKPLIAASMFGNTTELVGKCQKQLEAQGYEVLVFHATGTGGRVMESLIDENFISGVLDLTTTEWADELAGGVFSAGSSRLDAAAKSGTPQVIAPGCLDMVNFGGRETVPSKYDERQFYVWNPSVTLMRTTPEENAELGRILAEKANASTAPVAFFLPLKGVSILDSPGGEFWNPDADQALFDAIKRHARDDIPVYEIDANINDDAFAEAVTEKLLKFINDGN